MAIANIDITKTVTEVTEKIAQLVHETALVSKYYVDALQDLQRQGVKIDPTKLPEFLKSYWRITPTKNPNEWEIGVPVIFPDFSVGHWDRTEGGYNIFILNRFTQWFGGEIPSYIRSEINIPQALDIKFDGKNKITFPEDKKETVERKFGKHLSLIEKDHAVIKLGQTFDCIAEIINQGSLPFQPIPVDLADITDSDFTQIYDELNSTEQQPIYHPLEIFEGKYSYQGDAWKAFLKYGSIGLFWAMSFGKTVIGTYAFSRVKGKKALVVPSTILKQQWAEFFKHNCPRLLSEVEIYTYQGMSKKDWRELSQKQYSLMVFDECHFLPAESFSKLATLRTKYRIGLSATPYREDGHSNLVMALTGMPQGLDWRPVMQKLGKEYHNINIHVVKDEDAKYALAQRLFNPDRRTVFFVYRLEISDQIAKMLNIPFFNGAGGKQSDLSEVLKTRACILSKRYDHGLSIKDLDHVIEVDFQFGGRQEEMQRTGRLMHSESTGKTHDIIVTKYELENYGKRFYPLYEKGFKPRMITHLSEQLNIPSAAASKDRVKHTVLVNWRKTIDKLYTEGFFQIGQYSQDIHKELIRRGVKREDVGTSLNHYLDSMVRQEKLYKIPTEKGYKFIARNAK